MAIFTNELMGSASQSVGSKGDRVALLAHNGSEHFDLNLPNAYRTNCCVGTGDDGPELEFIVGDCAKRAHLLARIRGYCTRTRISMRSHHLIPIDDDYEAIVPWGVSETCLVEHDDLHHMYTSGRPATQRERSLRGMTFWNCVLRYSSITQRLYSS